MVTPSAAPWRQRLIHLLESNLAQNSIIVLILINAVTLGLETSGVVMAHLGAWITGIGGLILAIFTLEVIAKWVAYGRHFWRNPWNVFDFVVVGIALIPGSGPFSVLRVLRLLRLVSLIPKLRFIVESLLKAVPGIASVLGLLVLVFYVASIIATGLFRHSHPEWFGNLGTSLYTLFQVMTLESWSMGISRPVMEAHPWAWLFFISFILIVTFMVLNLFIAIIVDAMQSVHDAEHADERERVAEAESADKQALQAELRHLREQNQAMQQQLEQIQRLLEQRHNLD